MKISTTLRGVAAMGVLGLAAGMQAQACLSEQAHHHRPGQLSYASSGNGSAPAGGTPQQFDGFIRAEMARWARVAASVAIQPE